MEQCLGIQLVHTVLSSEFRRCAQSCCAFYMQPDHRVVLLSASPAAEDTPVEAKYSSHIGVSAIILLTSWLSLIVTLDVFYFLQKVRLTVKVKPRKENAHHSKCPNNSASPEFGYVCQPPPYYVNRTNYYLKLQSRGRAFLMSKDTAMTSSLSIREMVIALSSCIKHQVRRSRSNAYSHESTNGRHTCVSRTAAGKMTAKAVTKSPHNRDVTTSDLAYRRDLDALRYKLSIINFQIKVFYLV